MKFFKLTLLATLALSLLAPGSLLAENHSDASADKETVKVIFVRGKETSQTRSLKYNVYIGQEYVGRMKTNDRKELDIAAGNYTVKSNFYKGSELNVSLEAGKTYVISTTMENLVNSKETSFKLVSEGIASSDDVLENTDS